MKAVPCGPPNLPPPVDHELTELGRTLLVPLGALAEWPARTLATSRRHATATTARSGDRINRRRSVAPQPTSRSTVAAVPIRAAVWLKDGGTGCEFAELVLGPNRLTARGVAIASAPVPYRLDYTLETGTAFVTTLLDVASRGAGWSRRLLLGSDGAGTWSVQTAAEGTVDLNEPGGDPSDLAGALDCDLGLSPVTNLMPILRYGLASGTGRVEMNAAWVSVPDLRVQPDGQRYTALGPNLIRYEALDGGFEATITVDDDGLVVDYPGIARRI